MFNVKDTSLKNILCAQKKELVFQLGKTGSSYIVRDDLLYPYVKRGIYAQLNSPVINDSIEKALKPFFDSLNLSMNGIYEDRVVLIHLVPIIKSNKPQKYIGELLKHPLIFNAGEAYIPGEFFDVKKYSAVAPAIQTISGIKNEFTIQFENEYNLPNDATTLFATLEERQRIINKYKLKVSKESSLSTTNYISLTVTDDSPGTAADLLKLLLLEPIVKSGNTQTFPFIQMNDTDMK